MTAAIVLDSEVMIETEIRRTAQTAKEASLVLALADVATKNAALRAAAAAIRIRSDDIIAANDRDMVAAGEHDLTSAFKDRLKLTVVRVEAMAAGLEAIAERDDPVGKLIDEWTRPNGLHISRISVPLGVIGIIYESRPNVTADAGGLCLKSGNAVILRGGSDSLHSSGAIADCLSEGLEAAGLPGNAIQLVRTNDRAAVGAMLRQHDLIDIIVPRGGRGLIERVMDESTIPVLAHLEGICHVYVDKAANPVMARDIALNAKMRRTGICGAAETLLIDRPQATAQLPGIVDSLVAADCEVRGDATAQAIDDRIVPADESDWGTEYLDAIISVKIVDGVFGAVNHINRHGTNHTDAIVTEDAEAAEAFLSGVDSGIVMHNASTQFADGGEFGMGAEIGISTGKLHARGPVGADQLTSYKYVVRGDGQTRP